jgi:hypothetical protein
VLFAISAEFAQVGVVSTAWLWDGRDTNPPRIRAKAMRIATGEYDRGTAINSDLDILKLHLRGKINAGDMRGCTPKFIASTVSALWLCVVNRIKAMHT